MAKTNIFHKYFSGGEIDDSLQGHIESPQVASGLSKCENFIVLPYGPVINRPGFEFVEIVKEVEESEASITRLISFTYSDTDTYIIEIGDKYMRFYTNGTIVLNTDGDPYEIAHIYEGRDLAELRYIQSFDVLFFTHPIQPAQKLSRYDKANWVIEPLLDSTRYFEKNQIDYVDYIPLKTSTPVNTPHLKMIRGTKPGGTSASDWNASLEIPQYQLTFIDENGDESNPVLIALGKLASRDRSVLYAHLERIRLALMKSWGTREFVTRHPERSWLWARLDAEVQRDIDLMVSFKNEVQSLINKKSVPLSGVLTEINAQLKLNSGGQSHTMKTRWEKGLIYIKAIIESAFIGDTGQNLSQPGAINEIVWAIKQSDQTATSFRIYRKESSSGIFGLVGIVKPGEYIRESVSNDWIYKFIDNGITPDKTISPPEFSILSDRNVSSDLNFKGLCFFNQRLVLGGATNDKQSIYLSKIGIDLDFRYSFPTRSDSPLHFKIATRSLTSIQHLVFVKDLIILSDDSIWRMRLPPGEVTPSFNPETYIGASRVTPVVVNDTIVYCNSKRDTLYSLSYNYQVNGYIAKDLCLLAPHLFKGKKIKEIALSESPIPIVWVITDDGALRGLTFIPEQEITAWHSHSTKDGKFLSITVVREDSEDILYAIVRRTINNIGVNFIERLLPRVDEPIEEAFFVDSGVSFKGSYSSGDELSNLERLEGKEVSIVADGSVLKSQTVKDGIITLESDPETTVSIVQVGLPIIAEIKTLPGIIGIEGLGLNLKKNITKMSIKVQRTSGIFAGPSEFDLMEYRQRTTEPLGTPPELRSELIDLSIRSSWGCTGEIIVKQMYPLPIKIIYIILETNIGG